jgi:hypothetical protein
VNTVLETNIDNEQLFYLYIGDQLIEENGDVKDAVFLDGVHLSSVGLDVWAEYMKPKLDKLFDGKSNSP